ncbi:DsbA family protein [Microbacterium ulmi]|uniref:Thioredoxin domain-containing protein n=1 Tax=Microbacterium ulmi TaxID=179095 RepID=A0A7Y2M190_9MICO|nr:thioredoxin domain-containing protein [Microbacterium ulmi]NII70137.1 protein-disulfide isomerase [Microbacterium ulmi]NNH04322.1 thioredoxin domain-containing protein [Microbacterium ulmi]
MASTVRKTNWFAIWVSVGVVVALAIVAGLVVWMNRSTELPDVKPEASNIDVETGAIAVGSGENDITTFIDFMCPICNQFEQLYGETIQGLVDDGSATLNIHPISILDSRSQGTQFSTRAASAMYCVAVEDADGVLPFLEGMYANQPEEGTRGLTDDQIIGIATGAGVTGIDGCVNDGRYMKYVTAMTEKTPVAPGAQGIGTPTVLLNGEFVRLTGDPQADLVANLK